MIAEKTLNYTGEDAFYTETFEIPADVLKKSIKTIQVDGKDYTVVVLKFESVSATEDSARLVGGLSITINYNNNASLNAVTCNNGTVVQSGEEFTVTLPANTESTKLKFDIADRYGLVYVNDELINDAKAQIYTLTADTTTLSLKVYAEDHETMKNYTVKIQRGVEAPAQTPAPTPAPPGPGTNPPADKPQTTVPPTTTPTVKKKKASIKITAKKTVKKGKSITLKAKLTNVSGKVKWSVNKKKLAKITSKGSKKAKLKALKKGKVKVTAKVKKVKKTITIKIK